MTEKPAEDPGIGATLIGVVILTFILWGLYSCTTAVFSGDSSDPAQDYIDQKYDETECAALYLDALSDDSATAMDSAAKHGVYC